MKASVIVFPGSNCDRDARVALEGCGAAVSMVWHADAVLPPSDLVLVPGGFSYGDYLRSGAMAAHSPIMREVKRFADGGGYVLGICNGFQVLTEAGILPGVMMRNRDLKFICRDVHVQVASDDAVFTKAYKKGQTVRFPIAHHDGNYFCDSDTLKALEDGDRIAFRYCAPDGKVTDSFNPNGSLRNIAGILSENKNVLGMMPHPERASEEALGGADGYAMFAALAGRSMRK